MWTMEISDAAHPRAQSDASAGPLSELSRIVRAAVDYAGAESGSLFIVVSGGAAQQLSLKLAACSSAGAWPGVTSDGLVENVQRATRDGVPVHGEAVSHSAADANTLEGSASLALPVQRNGEVVAALYLEASEPGFSYTSEVVRGLTLLAQALADSIELQAHIDSSKVAADGHQLSGASLVQTSPSGDNLGDYVVHSLAEMIAIDFGDPLSAAAAHAHAGLQWLMQDPPQLERARSSLSKIASATNVTTEVLRSYRVHSVAPGYELHDIRDSLANALKLVSAIRPNASVAPELQLIEPIMVFADKRLLEQAFANIMSVLIDTEKPVPTPPVISIRCRLEDEWLTFALSDCARDGLGDEPSNYLDPIFTHKERQGGIKLAVASTLIRLHDGAVDVGGTANSGTIVLVKLPRKMMAR